MVFWIFLFLMDLLIPGMMIIFGWWFRGHPPKRINYVCGYRTKMSMKNLDTWIFAHRKSGEVWIRWGSWMTLTAAPMLFVIGRSNDVIGILSTVIMVLQIIPLLLSICPVEKALRETFDADGHRKS